VNSSQVYKVSQEPPIQAEQSEYVSVFCLMNQQKPAFGYCYTIVENNLWIDKLTELIQDESESFNRCLCFADI